MKIVLISLLSVFFLSSCAHHHKDAGGHHHHEKCKMKNCTMNKDKSKPFNNHCAMSVSMGDMHIEGNKDYKIDHGGKTYYFSTKKKMETFKANLQKNADRAREVWERNIDRI